MRSRGAGMPSGRCLLGYVDSPDGLRLVRSALQLVDERRHLALVVRLERKPRHAVHAVGLATRSRQYPFSRCVLPVVPVQQVVQVGESEVWMLTGRPCYFTLWWVKRDAHPSTKPTPAAKPSFASSSGLPTGGTSFPTPSCASSVTSTSYCPSSTALKTTGRRYALPTPSRGPSERSVAGPGS